MSTHSQEYLAARGEAVKSTVLALSALVSWELTHSTDLLRFTRVERIAKMAFDLEASYGTRVADVDDDHHSLAGRVTTRIVPDHLLRGDYLPPPLPAGAGRVALGTGVRVCRPADMEPDALVDADTRTDEERLDDAQTAIREANRSMDTVRRLIASARDSLAMVDPNADPNTMAAALEAEAQITAAHRMLDALPPRVADGVIDRVNNGQGRQNPHWEGGDGARYGAPYEEPPAAGGLGELAVQMGVPHLRPMMDAMQRAMAPMMPDPMTRLSQRLSALVKARNAVLVMNPEHDVSVLDRQIAKTQAELDQLEADNVPDPKPQTTTEPRDIT